MAGERLILGNLLHFFGHVSEVTMKKVLALSCLLLTLGAGAAMAADGIALAWDNCAGEVGANANKNFACNTDSDPGGAFKLVASFDAGLVDVVGIQAILDINSAPASLPSWWAIQTGGCRGTRDGIGDPVSPGTTGCNNDGYANNTAMQTNTGLASEVIGGSRLRQKYELIATDPILFNSGTHYYGMTVTLNQLNTVASACAGCSTPVCIGLSEMRFEDIGSAVTVVSDQLGSFSREATWQGGTGNCIGATPAKKSTWGSVKALYR